MNSINSFLPPPKACVARRFSTYAGGYAVVTQVVTQMNLKFAQNMVPKIFKKLETKNADYICLFLSKK